MGENEVQAVLSRFGEDIGKGEGDEAMNFVHIEIERLSFFFRKIRPAQGGQLNLGHNQSAEQRAVVFSDLTFSEIDNQNLALIHGLPEIKGIFFLADNVSERDADQKLADLVENRRNGL